ncbi:MAG: DUF3466 family protein [Acidobacteriota bacterium]
MKHSLLASIVFLSFTHITTAHARDAAFGSTAEYLVVDLGALGTGETYPEAINNLGQVVGRSYTGEFSPTWNYVSRAFLWLPAPAYGLPAGLNDLGSLRSDPLGSSQAFDLTDDGRVVGSSETDEPIFPDYPEPAWHGFVWQDGLMSALPTPSDNPIYDTAHAVNRFGEIAYAEGTGFGCTPYLWLPRDQYGLEAGFHRLASIGGLSEGLGHDINDQGQIVGKRLSACDVVGDANLAYLWLPKPAFGLAAGGHDVTPPGLPNTASVSAVALNESGQVVGSISDFSEPPAGFLWDQGTFTSLSFRPSAINEAAWIVGSNDTGAVLWRDGQLELLSDLVVPGSGWSLSRAVGINDRGQIIVRGRKNGRIAALLLDTTWVFGDDFESGDLGAWSGGNSSPTLESVDRWGN